ncbi:MAG: 4Fe-4S dicluster domain-containing protein [Candidatus Bathyarchaeota archaeon]|nr:MAG: 4Fe-4S dicluster domain-containing protein [Candidatus Bathyarchaeota archaeon]
MNFNEKIKYLTGESTTRCYQCGICSGSCPLRSAMDVSPMQLIRLINLEMEATIFSVNTFWICSTCFSCQARCPQGIKIPRLMEALRQMQLRKSRDYVHLNDVPQAELNKLPQIAIVSNQRKYAA